MSLPKDSAAQQEGEGTGNPKDLYGAVKVSISKLPAVGVLHGAHAMMDGAVKYGPYNWRAKKVIASIYVDAALRHIQAWFEGEECAQDSEAHHLGHAIACCSILLDAQETGNLVDDRPNGKGVASRIQARLSDTIKRRVADPFHNPQPGDRACVTEPQFPAYTLAMRLYDCPCPMCEALAK